MLAERHLDIVLFHVPEPELVMEVSAGELVQVVDAVLLAPVDDVSGPVVMSLDRCLGSVGRLVVEV